MKKTVVNISVILVIFSIVFASCKKEDETEDKYFFKSEGFIKGNISGLSADSIKVNDDFTFSNFTSESDATYSIYEIGENEIYNFNVVRYGSDLSNNITLSFSLEDLEDNTPMLDYQSGAISYTKKLDDNGLLVLDGYVENNSIETPVIINYLSFDKNTGKLKGNYKLLIEFSVERELEISGEFELITRQVFNK